MFGIVSALMGRFKAMFVREAALDLEAELLRYGAQRHADLERQAQHYEQEGLACVANDLRSRAARLDFDQPLAGILSAEKHLQRDLAEDASRRPKLPHEAVHRDRPLALTASRKDRRAKR